MSTENKNRTYYCPVCMGAGLFELPRNIANEDLEIKKYLVKLLKKKGYGIRQIQRALGYKSPQSVSRIINLTK